MKEVRWYHGAAVIGELFSSDSESAAHLKKNLFYRRLNSELKSLGFKTGTGIFVSMSDQHN